MTPSQEQLLENIQAFYKTSSLDPNSSYPSYEMEAKKFLEHKSDAYKKLFIEITDDEIRASLTLDSFDDLDFYLSVSNFVSVVKNVIEGYQPLFQNFTGLKRVMAPPIEVFQYKGFSELNIGQSKDSYARLFE